MKQETLQLTGGAGKDKRRELDYYPTPKSATVALMDFLFAEDRIDKDFKVWEPACGNGAMSTVIESYGLKVYSSDIRDTGFGSPYVDFIKNTGTTDVDAIITNPPFCLAEEFIRTGISKARLVCMLLKSQYWHAKDRINLFNDYPPAYVLPLTWRPDFLEHDRKPGMKKSGSTMEVAWSVWMRGSRTNTIYKQLLKPKYK